MGTIFKDLERSNHYGIRL